MGLPPVCCPHVPAAAEKRLPFRGAGSRHRRLTERSSPVFRPSSFVKPSPGNPKGQAPLAVRRDPGEPLWNGSPGASLPSFAALRKKVAPAGAKYPSSYSRPAAAGKPRSPSLRSRCAHRLWQSVFPSNPASSPFATALCSPSPSPPAALVGAHVARSVSAEP